MPIGQGFSTVTVANSPLPFTYQATSAALPLAIGFIPTAVYFWGVSSTWSWCRGMAFGDAHTASVNFTIGPVTGGVLDILDGSGRASPNVATTSPVIGLLIGSNTQVNAGGTFFGLCYR